MAEPHREQFPWLWWMGRVRGRVSLTEPLGSTDKNMIFCGFKALLVLIVMLIYCGLCRVVHVKT